MNPKAPRPTPTAPNAKEEEEEEEEAAAARSTAAASSAAGNALNGGLLNRALVCVCGCDRFARAPEGRTEAFALMLTAMASVRTLIIIAALISVSLAPGGRQMPNLVRRWFGP